MRNVNYSLQLPILQPATINGMNVIVLPANLKFLSTPRKTLPSFSGSTNGALVEDWLQESEKVATLEGWNDAFKLQKFSNKLKGDALTYYQTDLTSINDYSTWRNMMIEKFAQNDKNFYLLQLPQLRQKPNQSVRAFAEEIDSLLVKTLGLGVVTDRSLKTFCFRVKMPYLNDGLREEIRKEIPPSFFKYRGRSPSWPFVVEKVQDIEWLIHLRKNKVSPNNLQLCNHVKVYLAMSANAKIEATGFGVFFGENDPKNVSQNGDRTCNASLITAAITAIQQAKKHGIERLVIHTSSEYLLKFFEGWGISWLQHAWRRPNGKLVLNSNHWRSLLTTQEGMDIKWAWIDKNENWRAQDLARNGLKKCYPRAISLPNKT